MIGYYKNSQAKGTVRAASVSSIRRKVVSQNIGQKYFK